MKKIVLIITALVLLTSHAARAEVFVWKDPDYGIKVTYPDNWMRQAQRDEDMRLFILAPQGSDHAACRLQVRQDNRFMDAPASAGQSVTNFVFNKDAVRNELVMRQDTNNVRLTSFTGNGTLGRGAATLSHLEFQKNWGGTSYAMHAMVLASQYNGKAIFMSCETLVTAWKIWEPTILSILKSVDFPAAYATAPNGLYRPFQYDGSVYFPLNRRGDGVTTF